MRKVGVAGWSKLVVLGTALLFALLFGAVAGAGKHGVLDPSFTNLRGRVVTSFGPGDDAAGALAILSDGRSVVVGHSSNGADDDFAVARYQPDGSLDPTFGTGGKVTTAVGPGEDIANAVVIQKDGKVVVAGTSFNGTDDDFALARYNPDGSLDTTFDGDGKVTTPIGSGDDRAYALALQGDGKLVVAGSSHGANDDFALARYNPDGSPDTTFDADGIVTTAIGSSGDSARALALQKDGKLVAAGSSSNGSNNDFAIARYNVDGSLDATFDGDGNVTTTIGSGNDEAFAIIQQQDGKLVAAGDSAGSNYEFALVRYTKSGALDTSFGNGGKVPTAIGAGDDHANALAVGGDGRLVAGGSASNGASDDFALARYKSNGSLDVFTSRPGVVTTPFGSGDDVARALKVASSGRPVAAGSSWNGSDEDFALARYNGDGSPDLSFGGEGRVTTSIGPGDDVAYALALPGSKLVAAGSSWNGSNNDFALVRYTASGTPDSSFGSDGVVMTPIGSGDDVAYAVVVQKDGKIVAAGSSWSGSSNDFALVRYNSDGSLDTTFGVGGIVTTPVGFGGVARALALQSDGKLLAAGAASNGVDDDFALVRYTTGGTPDAVFGTGGKVTTPVGLGGDAAFALVLQNGKPIAAGSSWNGSNNDFALVRYTASGTPDSSFGSGGKVTTSIGSGDDEAYALGLQKNGKLIAAGASWNGVDDDFALVRYETNGSLNPSFGSGGKVTTSLGAGNDEIRGAAVQTNRLVVAGEAFNGSDEDFALSLYVLCAAPKGC
jgi:uncharacterized delta-60 repeat protein